MKWRTKDGRIMHIRDMETDHIKSCIAMLERNGYVSVNDFYASIAAAASLQGEYASLAAEQEVAGMKPVAILDAFEDELSERWDA